jgi:hypothetical protein
MWMAAWAQDWVKCAEALRQAVKGVWEALRPSCVAVAHVSGGLLERSAVSAKYVPPKCCSGLCRPIRQHNNNSYQRLPHKRYIPKIPFKEKPPQNTVRSGFDCNT